jgi:hypothetical protein
MHAYIHVRTRVHAHTHMYVAMCYPCMHIAVCYPYTYSDRSDECRRLHARQTYVCRRQQSPQRCVRALCPFFFFMVEFLGGVGLGLGALRERERERETAKGEMEGGRERELY